ncbi:MAG TPA: hypothetical protein VFR07_11770 [Mycobacteriales bacterium]|nr:hypothetical protein [Mycobacteriales bacterium]
MSGATGAPVELPATIRLSGPDGGSAVGDDGTEIGFPAGAVDPRLRALHPGQRVRLLLVAGQVRSLTLVSLPMPVPSG